MGGDVQPEASRERAGATVGNRGRQGVKDIKNDYRVTHLPLCFSLYVLKYSFS